MSDKENEQHLDEEYHFTEEPDLDMPPVDEPQDQDANKDPLTSGSRSFDIEKVKDFFYDNTPARNLVVVVGLLLVLYVAYKIFSGLFTGGHHELAQPVTKPITTTVVAPKPLDVHQ